MGRKEAGDSRDDSVPMHNRILLRTLASLSAAALLPLAPAPAWAASGLPDALDAIAAYAPRAMREQGTPGLSVAITDRTKTLRIITLGYANRETQAPVTAQTRFAIGSITKSMTALALLELRDSGRLDLDAPVRRYLPWFAIKSLGGPILMHELLSHTGWDSGRLRVGCRVRLRRLGLTHGKDALRPRRLLVVFERRLRNRGRRARASRRAPVG